MLATAVPHRIAGVHVSNFRPNDDAKNQIKVSLPNNKKYFSIHF